MTAADPTPMPSEAVLADRFMDSLAKASPRFLGCGVIPFSKTNDAFDYVAGRPKPQAGQPHRYVTPHEQWAEVVSVGLNGVEFDTVRLADLGHTIVIPSGSNLCPHQVIRTAIAALTQAMLTAPMDNQGRLSISPLGVHYQNIAALRHL